MNKTNSKLPYAPHTPYRDVLMRLQSNAWISLDMVSSNDEFEDEAFVRHISLHPTITIDRNRIQYYVRRILEFLRLHFGGHRTPFRYLYQDKGMQCMLPLQYNMSTSIVHVDVKFSAIKFSAIKFSAINRLYHPNF